MEKGKRTELNLYEDNFFIESGLKEAVEYVKTHSLEELLEERGMLDKET